jgi:hypothetical protein
MTGCFMCFCPVVGELFKLISDAYAPWIQPIEHNGKMLLPWILNEDPVAADMVSEWIGAVQCLHNTFTGCTIYILTLTHR